MNQFSGRSLTDTRNGRLFLFGFFYFVQGAMLAYVLVFNNLYLRNFGATAAQLSLLNGLLVFPFILKIGIGILSDKYGLARPLPLLGRGHRVPYMVMGLLLIIIGSALASFIPPVEMYPLFVGMALFIAAGLSLFDTVADGLAIDVTPPDQQGLVQSTMVMGRAVGLVALAAVYGRIIQYVNWQIVFWIVTAFAAIPLFLLRLVREPAQRTAAQTFQWNAFAGLWRPAIGRFALYAVLYSVCIYGANAIVTLFANEELGGTLVQVGDIAALGGLGMVGGAGVATLVARKASIWQRGVWTTAAVSLALLLIAFTNTLQNITIVIILWGFCLAASELIFVTLAMSKADRRMGAGQFAIFMAISNVGTGIGQATTTGLIDTIDFSWIFAALALLNLLALPILAAMRGDDPVPATRLWPVS
jgi:MFS transporter, PAT family, beta-lactamase induction signal transducer AmpG